MGSVCMVNEERRKEKREGKKGKDVGNEKE